MTKKTSYLARMRNDANFSQAQMAQFMDVTQNQISRWERNPDTMNAGVRDVYCRLCGVPPTIPEPDTATELVPDAAARDALQEEIRVLSSYIDTVSPPDLSLGKKLPGSLPEVKDLLKSVRILARKPRIGVVGGFDQGKSTLVNTLLGLSRRQARVGEALPESYAPATSLICLVRHASDRPEWMKKDPELMNQDTFIFTETANVRKTVKGLPGLTESDKFKFDRLDDEEDGEEYFRSFKRMSGGLGILRDFGTKRGRHATLAKGQNMYAALVFVDAPLLRMCDVLDFPGYDDGEEKEAYKPEFAATLFDIPVYVSNCIGFFNGYDREYVDSLIKQLPPVEDVDSSVPPLRNAYFVATRASLFDGAGPETIDQEILRPQAELAHMRLEGALRNVRAGGVTKEDFTNRFFTFDAEHPELRSDFESDLSELLERVYPDLQRTRVERAIHGTRDKAVKRLVNYERHVDGLLKNSSSKAKELVEMERLEPARKKKRNGHAEFVRGKIEEFKRDANDYVENELREECSQNRIHSIILEKFNERKLAKDEAPQYVVNRLSNLLDEHVAGNAWKLAEHVEALHDLYDKSSGDLGVRIPFDSRGAFIAAIAGAGTYGALATWASLIAAGSNLGAYILTAKVVSYLSAIGISVGGTAAAASAVAMIGGPITIFIALATLVAFVGWALFGASWQERLAKRIHKSIEEQEVIQELAKGARKYWKSTRKAFDKAFEATEKEYRRHMKGLRKHLVETDTAALEWQKEQLSSLRRAFEGIPWRRTESKSDG